MTMSLRRKPLWSRGAVLCQAALVLSSAWGGKHAWAEAARGESTTTVASASAQVETTGNRQLSAVGLEPPAEIVSKIMLGVPSGTLPEVNPLWRGSQGRPRRRLSSLPFNAPDIERRRQTGGRRRGEGMVMEEGLSVARDEGGGVMVVGAGPAAGAGGGTDGRMGDGRERRKLRGHRTRKRALRRGAAPVSRDSADSIREAQKEEEGRSLAIGVKAVATEGEDATLHRRFGGEASTVTSRVERRNERRAVDRAVFRAPPIVAGPSEEEEDAAEKKGGSVWSIWNQRRRAAGEQPQASATETQAHDDDEAVDGFGSVGLLAFLVCFGLLFCVVEVAKCYCLFECRRRRQLRRRRAQDGENTEGRMPVAVSRPVAPSIPEAGSKDGWVEVVIDGIATRSGGLPGDENAKDMPSAKGYPVADASHALREAVEEAQRMSPSTGSCNIFSPPAPAAGPPATARAQTRPSPAPSSAVAESSRHIS